MKSRWSSDESRVVLLVSESACSVLIIDSFIISSSIEFLRGLREGRGLGVLVPRSIDFEIRTERYKIAMQLGAGLKKVY